MKFSIDKASIGYINEKTNLEMLKIKNTYLDDDKVWININFLDELIQLIKDVDHQIILDVDHIRIYDDYVE